MTLATTERSPRSPTRDLTRGPTRSPTRSLSVACLIAVACTAAVASTVACGASQAPAAGVTDEQPTPVDVESDVESGIESGGVPGGASDIGSDTAGHDDIRIAAIERAVNETRAAQHECWAFAAADDFRLQGAMVVRLTFAQAGGNAAAEVVSDEPGDARLSACITELFERYLWPEVFEPGQAIELPLLFHAPRGQYTVAGGYVEPVVLANGALHVSVLLHEQNTGNGAAALSRLVLTGDADIPLHRHHTSAEILYVERGSVIVLDHGSGSRGTKARPKGVTLRAGQAVYIPAGTVHGGAYRGTETASVVQLFTPAGPHMRYLTGRPVDTILLDERERARPPRGFARPIVVTRPTEYTFAGGGATVALYFDEAVTRDKAAYMGVLSAQPGTRVPAHRHERESEYLLILRGSGTMSVRGESYAVAPDTAIQIPANTEHSVVVQGDEPLVAVQFYTPGGPEQRFKSAGK